MEKSIKTLKNSEKGITLIALVVTIIVLLILAGISIAMLTGNNGILQKATDAKTETEKGQEKEIIALAYNSALTKKMGNGNSVPVTSEDMNTELTNEGANASGSNPITVTFEKSKRQYTINSYGEIKELINRNNLNILKDYFISKNYINGTYNFEDEINNTLNLSGIWVSGWDEENSTPVEGGGSSVVVSASYEVFDIDGLYYLFIYDNYGECKNIEEVSILQLFATKRFEDYSESIKYNGVEQYEYVKLYDNRYYKLIYDNERNITNISELSNNENEVTDMDLMNGNTIGLGIAIGDTKNIKDEIILIDFFEDFQCSSNNSEVVQIDSEGNITGISEGETKIILTGKKSGKSKEFEISVFNEDSGK